MFAPWQILLAFVFRLSLGVAVAMALTPSSKVTAGFYRVHLWVLMGLGVLGALAAWSAPSDERWLLAAPAVLLAVVSYAGAVCWLYERSRPGTVALLLAAAVSLWGAIATATPAADASALARLASRVLDPPTSGLLLGAVTTAMLLGHWYLNTPTMQLAPLRRLLWWMAATLALRLLVSGGGLGGELMVRESPDTAWWLFLSLRWLAGFVGVGVLTVLTWQTLKIPNTQSATGILYAAVILAFIGELTSQLLSAQAAFPL